MQKKITIAIFSLAIFVIGLAIFRIIEAHINPINPITDTLNGEFQEFKDFLIEDETYLVSDTTNIGYTFNETVANILIERGCTIIYLDEGKYWFSFEDENQIHLCSDPTHINCDGECACDGLSCD